MPDTMAEYVMVVNERLQALAAFEDAADIGATAQHLGHHGEGVLRPKTSFLPQNGPDLVTVHTRESMPSAVADALLLSSPSRLDVIWDNYPDDNLIV